MFIDGVRTSTWAAIGAFIIVALVRRDRRVIFAGWVWISGFEAAFGLTSWLMHDHTVAHATKLALLTVVGVVTVPFFASAYGIRPAVRIMLAAAALWLAWVAVGFPINAHDATTINPLAEALNEATKTLWALAYLWPLLRLRSSPLRSWRSPSPGAFRPVPDAYEHGLDASLADIQDRDRRTGGDRGLPVVAERDVRVPLHEPLRADGDSGRDHGGKSVRMLLHG